MMNVQYIADKAGHTKAVQIQIPIEDWDMFKLKYKEFSDDENVDSEIFTVPEWQIELGRAELKHIEDGTTELLDWEQAQKQFKK